MGVRVKASPQTKMPRKWTDFLRDSNNKTELFSLLSAWVSETSFDCNKDVYITGEDSVIHKGSNQSMMDTPYEEADVRIIVHVKHVIENGSTHIQVRTSDTDVLVILIGHFDDLNETHPHVEITVAFGFGKDFRLYNVRDIVRKLGPRKARALPLFHSFTGSDTTSSFFGRSKKTAWNTWQAYDKATDAFLFMKHNPFHNISTDSMHFKTLERFTMLMYDKSSSTESVNEARREMFCRKSRNIDNLPPTQDALLQHCKRVTYQGGIWTSCTDGIEVPSPHLWGWKKDEELTWTPVWMTIPDAAKACNEQLIKCTHNERATECSICSCAKADLPCTQLCDCPCEK